MLARHVRRVAAALPMRTAPLSTAVAPDAKDRLIVFDTTLRDGEQSPGATLQTQEKIQIARQLSLLGVDVCEAGFPIASPGDFEAVKLVATEVGPLLAGRKSGEPMRICGLSRAKKKDIERCYEAVSHAPLHRIHTFLATSDIHLEYKLKISRDECIRQSVEAVEFAKSLCGEGGDVEFSTEDAGRSDPDFLCLILAEVIKAGATTLNIPDTVGYTVPGEYGDLIAYLKANTEGSEKAVFSVHCHNDLGLATANSLQAIQQGARQVEVTLNGIGERAGNTSLEEIIMTINTRKQHYPVYHNVESTQIMKTSRMVSTMTGMNVQPNKAIVGQNAFAHEAGIHQDGVLKHQATYEIMLPESVGLTTNSLVLGKHSGRHAFKKRLEVLGYSDLSEERLDELVTKFKVLADEKKVVTDADMDAIAADMVYKEEGFWTLESIHVTSGNLVKSTAIVVMKDADGNEHSEVAMGSGPVDALYQAISRATKLNNRLLEFTIGSVTDGTKALGAVTVRVGAPEDDEGREDNLKHNAQTGIAVTRDYLGHGTDNDIIYAGALAYVNALNRMLQQDK